jgi:hypothetical protein
MKSVVDYDALIPNNVDLRSDRRLQRALERWYPNFRNWWLDMGPDGRLVSAEDFEKSRPEWLGTEEDEEYICSLMAPVTEPGKFANWIAAPKAGIDGNPTGYEYVKLAG